MHELPVTQSILDLAIETAQKHGAARVIAIDLVIGDLSSIVDDSVQFYFDLLSRGTMADGAELRFQREPAVASCNDCSHQFDVTPPLALECPLCDSHRLQVRGGREFYVATIDVE